MHRQKFILSFFWWTIQKSNSNPCGKIMGQSDPEEPTEITNEVYLECTQRQCEATYSTSLFHSIHWWSTNSTTCLRNLWSIVVVTCKGLHENALSAFCELANKSKDMRHEEVSTPCLVDRDGYDWRNIRRMHANRCNMFHSGHNWKPDIIWTLNNLTSHASKWNEARGKYQGGWSATSIRQPISESTAQWATKSMTQKVFFKAPISL